MTAELADRLLAAHIDFTRRELLNPESYQRFVINGVESALDEAARLTLAESVTPEMIKNTAYKYAVQIPVEGAIPELVGEIAARLHRHPVNDDVALADLLDAHRFDELISVVAATGVTQRAVEVILDSPVTLDVCVEVIASAIVHDDNRSAGEAGEAGEGPRSVFSRGIQKLTSPTRPWVTNGVEWVTRAGARRVLDAAGAQSQTVLLEVLRDIWHHGSEEMTGSLREVLTADDLEDLVVVIFEFWKSFRETDYFRTLLHEGIDHVFDKYGDVTLVDLLADLGIGRADLIEEGLRFGPPVLARLDERGILDEQLRRQFEPFYHSAEFQAALNSP